MVFDYTIEQHNIVPEYQEQLQDEITQPYPVALHFSEDLQHGAPIDEPITRGLIYVTQPVLV